MKHIFDQARLGSLPLKNRLIRSATWEALADEAGNMEETLYAAYEGLAKGGVGAIISGFTSVADNDHYFDGMARLSNDSLIPQHNRLTGIAHRYQCPMIVQLALGEYNRGSHRGMAIDGMTRADIETVKLMFSAASDRAIKAGYDGVQIHAAHGFFLSRFISPAYNHRKDEYGGTAENRGRIILEILRDVREKYPALHITMKINCSDFVHGGLVPEDSMTICKLCARAGIGSIEVSGGGTSVPNIRPGVNEAYFQGFAAQLADLVEIPVILVGGHRSVEHMEKVLNESRIEFLSLSRPLILEPDLPSRWKNGDTSPAKCISCNSCYRTPGHECVFKRRA